MSFTNWRANLVYQGPAMQPPQPKGLRMLRIGFRILVGLVMMLVMFLPYQTITATSIPTIDISTVVADEMVTIVAHNYPAHQVFTVRMNEYGTYGIDGTVVGSFDSGAGGTFSVSFGIPDWLKGEARIAIRTDSIAGFFSYNWFNNHTAPEEDSDYVPSDHGSVSSGYSGVPTFLVVDVEQDDSVTIRTHNYPKDQKFTVRMGKYGSLGIGGYVVGTFDSGDGGILELNFHIPDDLHGLTRIAIRADCTKGYFSYNWFWNNTVNTTGSTGGQPEETAKKSEYSGIPTFKIIKVDHDNSVTIRTHNFPAEQSFTVRMGEYGTLGIGGTKVDTTDSSKGGTFEVTYVIPDYLHGRKRIAIRLESSPGYYSYNWFWNTDADLTGSSDGTGGHQEDSSEEDSTTESDSSEADTSCSLSSYRGIPTFSISSVVRDDTVTLRANNLPRCQAFTVRMGEYGTLGVGGSVVATTDSGEGGSFTITYSIPAALHGRTRIAIRMDSPGGFYAYNWFWNNTSN
jgi:hypothetical protein